MSSLIKTVTYDPDNIKIIQVPSTQKTSIPLSRRNGVSFLAEDGLVNAYQSLPLKGLFQEFDYNGEVYLDVPDANGSCVLYAVASHYLLSLVPYKFSELHNYLYTVLEDKARFQGDYDGFDDEQVRYDFYNELRVNLSSLFKGLDFTRGYPKLVDAVEFLLDYGILPNDPNSIRFVKTEKSLYHCVLKLGKAREYKKVVMPKQWCSEDALIKFQVHAGFRKFIHDWRSISHDESIQVSMDEIEAYLLSNDHTFWIVNQKGDEITTILSGRGRPNPSFIGIRHSGESTLEDLREALKDPAREGNLLGHWEALQFKPVPKKREDNSSKKGEKLPAPPGSDNQKGNRFFSFSSSGIKVNTAFKFGKRGEDYVRSNYPKDVGDDSFTQPYGHPFARFAADCLTTEALRRMAHSSIFEIAAKYNRTGLILERSKCKSKYIPNRPIITDYDKDYIARYPCKWPLNTEKISGSSIITQNILAVDCIYYPGVDDGIVNNVLAHKTDAYFVYQEVPEQVGKYFYFDYEGHVLVTKRGSKFYVDNRPKGNDKVYKHERFWLPYGFSLVKRRGVDYRCLDRIQVGSGVNMVLVKVSTSMDLEEEALAHSLLDGFVPTRIEEIPLDLNLANDILPPIYDGKVRDAISAYLSMKGNLQSFVKSDGLTNCLTYVNAVTKAQIELNNEFRQLATDVAIEIQRHNDRHQNVWSFALWNYFERLIVYMYQELKDAQVLGALRSYVQKESRVGAIADLIDVHKWMSRWVFFLTATLGFSLLAFTLTMVGLVYSLSSLRPMLLDLYSCFMGEGSFLLYLKTPMYILLLISLYNIIALFRKIRDMGLDIIFLILLIVTSYIIHRIYGSDFVPRAGGVSARANYLSFQTKIVPMSGKRFQDILNHPINAMRNMVKPVYRVKGDQVSYSQFIDSISYRPLKVVKDTVYNVLPASLKWLGPSIPSSDKLYGAWGFFLRHVTPRVLPDPDFKLDLKKFLHNSGLMDEYKESARKMEMLDFPTYLKKVEVEKRGAYQKGYDRFKLNCKIPMVLQITTKPDEKQYKDIGDLYRDVVSGKRNADDLFDAFKARNIFNPSEQVKAVLGWFGYNLQRVTKEIPTFKGCYCQGWTTEDLEENLVEAWNSVENPCGMDYDGGFHDAHQHAKYLEDVDNEIIRELAWIICPKMGLNKYEIEEIIKKVTLDKVPVTMYSDHTIDGTKLFGGNRIMIFCAILIQSVFSGHPTRTTWGNTNRQLVLIYFIALSIGMRWKKDIWPFQGGDDFYTVINRVWRRRFRTELLKYYSEKEGLTHGWGQLMKDYRESENQVNFLSKCGYVSYNKSVVFRKYDRVVWTGLVTTSVGKSMTMGDYYQSIKKMMDTCYGNIRGISSVLSWRDSFYGHLKGDNSKKERVFELVKDVRHDNVSDTDLYLAGQLESALLVESCSGNPEALEIAKIAC